MNDVEMAAPDGPARVHLREAPAGGAMKTRQRTRPRRKQSQRRSKKEPAASPHSPVGDVERRPVETTLPEAIANARRMPSFIFATGDPRYDLSRLAMDFEGPVEKNLALAELRRYEALRGGDVGERILSYLRLRSESSAPAVRERGKLPKSVLAKNVIEHPIGKLKRDGSRFTVNDRVAALKRDGVVITRSALAKRLKAFQEPQHGSAPAS